MKRDMVAAAAAAMTRVGAAGRPAWAAVVLRARGSRGLERVSRRHWWLWAQEFSTLTDEERVVYKKSEKSVTDMATRTGSF